MPHFGILNINKPAGCTSRHVVDRVERLVRPAKAGHAGTLDPLAAGVLVVCVGQATRLIPYVQKMPKRYQATFLLGRHSATDDIEGEVTLLENAQVPTQEAVAAALQRFLGDIEQVPPAHSAVKIGGRRAYKLARAGKAPILAARTVTIHELRLTHYEYPQLELDIECGSGTYVRSLGRDLAASLGTAAVMTALERTAIGDFRAGNAVALDDLHADSLAQHLQPAFAAVPSMPRIAVTEIEVGALHNGGAVERGPQQATTAIPAAQEFAAIDEAGQLASIVREKCPGQFWPVLNFFR